jgi:hypothetical protein
VEPTAHVRHACALLNVGNQPITPMLSPALFLVLSSSSFFHVLSTHQLEAFS